jgi:signal transduction histidine kinase
MSNAAARQVVREGPQRTLPKILLVDDRRENLVLLQAILAKMDAQLVAAASGAEALDILHQQNVALVLLDVSMPEMDGFEVARRMHENSKLAHIPIIFVTAVARDENSVMNGYAAGVVDFLFKPIHPHIVRSKVQVFLNLFEDRQDQEVANRNLSVLPEQLMARNAIAENAAREIALQKAELEHRNRELQLRNRELDTFAYVVSHDLRQPVHSILDYVDLIELQVGGGADPNVDRWLNSCRGLCQSMHALITDVLDFATMGPESVDLQPVDANVPLFHALDALLPAIRQSEALVAYDSLPRVLGSEKLLTRMFQNLIANAIKYRSAQPPRIQVRCEWDEGRRNWLIRVIDNGRGIAKSDAARVFDMLARGQDSASIPGNGIGLAICKRIAEAHGGRIWVNSEPGEGSEFVFMLRDAGDCVAIEEASSGVTSGVTSVGEEAEAHGAAKNSGR